MHGDRESPFLPLLQSLCWVQRCNLGLEVVAKCPRLGKKMGNADVIFLAGAITEDKRDTIRVLRKRKTHSLNIFFKSYPLPFPLPASPSLLLLLVLFGSPRSTRNKAQLGTNWSESLNHIPCAAWFTQQMALPENRIVRTCMNADSSPRGNGSCM